MIRAVFFDLYNTLVRFDPPREAQQVAACSELGIEVEPEAIRRGYQAADDFWSQENARLQFSQRTEEEKRTFFTEYETLILRAAGVEVSGEIAYQIVSGLRQRPRKFVLFDDVLPAIDSLKNRGLVTGLLSNIRRNLGQLCAELGLAPYLDILLTSEEVGAAKPHPPIFLAALERAGVGPGEVIHVGDQYHSDVVGARGVGITPVLIDRDNFFPDVRDCPRIRNLAEVEEYL